MRSALSPARPGVASSRTLYASPKEMAEWLASARPGGEMIYASGPAINHREPAAMLAGEWGRAGLVHAYQKRRPGAEGAHTIDFVVRKLKAPLRQAQGERIATPARRPQDDPDWENSEQGRVYRLLCRCANLGQPCPSNQQIADRLDLRDRHRANYLIVQLRERGLIRIEAAAKLGPRVVRIVASGKVTPEVQS